MQGVVRGVVQNVCTGWAVYNELTCTPCTMTPGEYSWDSCKKQQGKCSAGTLYVDGKDCKEVPICNLFTHLRPPPPPPVPPPSGRCPTKNSCEATCFWGGGTVSFKATCKPGELASCWCVEELKDGGATCERPAGNICSASDVQSDKIECENGKVATCTSKPVDPQKACDCR